MFHVHAHHQSPFWWRRFSKLPAPAASDTQQKDGLGDPKFSFFFWLWKGSTYSIVWFLFNPSVRRLEGDNFKLKIPPMFMRKAWFPSANTPIDFVAPEALMRQSSSPSPQAFLGDDSPFGFNMIQEGGWWWFMLMNGKSHGKNSSTIMNQHEYCGNITGNIKNESNEHWLMLRVIVLSWDYSNDYKFFCLKK